MCIAKLIIKNKLRGLFFKFISPGSAIIQAVLIIGGKAETFKIKNQKSLREVLKNTIITKLTAFGYQGPHIPIHVIPTHINIIFFNLMYSSRILIPTIIVNAINNIVRTP